MHHHVSKKYGYASFEGLHMNFLYHFCFLPESSFTLIITPGPFQDIMLGNNLTFNCEMSAPQLHNFPIWMDPIGQSIHMLEEGMCMYGSNHWLDHNL